MNNRLNQYINENKISQSQIARELGISKTALNQYLQGIYAGNLKNIDEKVAAFFRLQEERKTTAQLQVAFVETPTAKQILGFLGLSHVLRKFGIVYGGAGLGKTTAIKEYVRRNPSCVFIEPDMGYTAKVLLQEICKALNLPEKGTIHELTDRIVEVLKDSGRMLIVDEAELLPLRALECVRRIYDKSGCALQLVGMPRLLQNLKGANAEFKQLFSRVCLHCPLGNDVKDVDLLEIISGNLKECEEAEAKHLVKVSHGNVRRLVNLMTIIKYLMQVNRMDSVEKKLIDKAVSYLIS